MQARTLSPRPGGAGQRTPGHEFLPGRKFDSPTDFNAQLARWIERADSRQHRSLGCQPAQRWTADRAAMLALPPVPPALGWRETVRPPRDYYVRVDSNDYSVQPPVIGRRVDVCADSQTVTATCAGRTVAVHDLCWARRQSITDLEHRAAAEVLRTAPPVRSSEPDDVQQRPLADYEAFFGLTEDVA